MSASETRSRPAPLRRAVAATAAAALALTGVAVTAAPAHAATFIVTNLNDDGVGSLREAISQANADAAPDVITFSPGLNGTIPLASTLEIVFDTTIDGTGSAITISRDNAAGDFDLVWAHLPVGYVPFTLIDVDITGDGAAPVQLGRGLVVEGDGGVDIGRVQLTDVTIANHQAQVGDGGGGAYIGASSYVDILRSSFSSNQTAPGGSGGGVYVDGGHLGSLHVTQSSFISNLADQSGGGIFVDQVNGVWVDDSVFQLNLAAVFVGGGIAMDEIAMDGVSITASTFDENQAQFGGGGVSLRDTGVPTIANSVFTNNVVADGNVGRGGAVYIAQIATGFTVFDSTFTGNGSQIGGVLLVEDIPAGQSATVTGSTFSANLTSSGSGASILIGTIAGSFTLENSTLDELVASHDAYAVRIFDTLQGSTTTISHSTITGPGAVMVGANDGTTTIENSILDGTPGNTGGTVFAGAGAASIVLSHTLTVGPNGSGVTDGGGNVTAASPGLLPLADNGGPTWTRLPEAGSPAIDAGDPAFAPPPVTDQRGAGFARVLGGRLDIGAVEVTPTLPATGGTVSWWLLVVAGGVLILGVVALVLTRRRRSHG